MPLDDNFSILLHEITIFRRIDKWTIFKTDSPITFGYQSKIYPLKLYVRVLTGAISSPVCFDSNINISEFLELSFYSVFEININNL